MFRQHTSLVGRGTEFDSRADLRVKVWVDLLARRLLSCTQGTGIRMPRQFIFSNGLLVQRDDTGIARRRSGFDSLAVHSAESAIEGPMVQGDDVALAWRRSGFDSRWVHSNGR